MNLYPSITALRCLDAVARCLSFTKAAAEMHLTQSAVSHHILGLEKQLECSLFVRRRTGLELTPAGRSYWETTAPLLHQLARATENMIATEGKGEVFNLSVSSTLGNYWLMPRLHHFLTAHPFITLNLSTRVGPVDFAHSEDDASVDFCAGADAHTNARLVMRSVLRPYIAPSLLAPGQAQALAQGDTEVLVALLRQLPLIRRVTIAEAWPQWLECADLADAVSHAHLAAGPRYALLSMAVSGAILGLGISLLPDFMAQSAVDDGKLVCMSSTQWVAPRAYYLRWPSDRAETPAMQLFSQWLQAQTASAA